MAGICGIINMSREKAYDYSNHLKNMLGKLGIIDSQTHNTFFDQYFFIGNVSAVNMHISQNYIKNNQLEICLFCDGLIFIDPDTKEKLKKKYNISEPLCDLEYVPFLYNENKTTMGRYVTGWYNLLILDIKRNEAFLLNDRFAYLPLFYYKTTDVFIFSSKIESILASGLMKSIEIDTVSISERFIFNYVISDNTYIKEIRTLSHATFLYFSPTDNINRKKYWEFSEWLTNHPLKKRESIDYINHTLKNSIKKTQSLESEAINVSLTGGWDSRLLLSYLISMEKELNIYSFGDKNAPDVLVPKEISLYENLNYTPIILDNNYLEKHFFSYALKTIEKSNGTRNFKRSHYLYSMEHIEKFSPFSVSGIYGDEIFKFSEIKPNAVISANAINFLSTNLEGSSLIENYKENWLWTYFLYKKGSVEEFENRLCSIKKDMDMYDSLSQKYYYFRLLINLSKYFGAEVNSYNDYSMSFSPFIDSDFLKAFFKTTFCGVHYPFNSKSLKLKKQTSFLYSELIKRNNKNLLHYSSDRGHTISDTQTLLGNFKILYLKFIKNKKNSDPFNTSGTLKIFKEQITQSDYSFDSKLNMHINLENMQSNNADILSLFVWINNIYKNYL